MRFSGKSGPKPLRAICTLFWTGFGPFWGPKRGHSGTPPVLRRCLHNLEVAKTGHFGGPSQRACFEGQKVYQIGQNPKNDHFLGPQIWAILVVEAPSQGLGGSKRGPFLTPFWPKTRTWLQMASKPLKTGPKQAKTRYLSRTGLQTLVLGSK